MGYMTDDDEIPISITWLVSGKGGMGMSGFTPDCVDAEPAISVVTSASGTWSFHFRDYEGEGKIQVSKGSDYNPLDLIETLFRHLNKCSTMEDEINEFRQKQPAPIQWNGSSKYSKTFKEQWE